MRNYIRHPSDIPIEIVSDDRHQAGHEHLNNVSHGGLSISSDAPMTVGEIITLRIAVTKHGFEARGRIAWCHDHGNHYDVGIEFLEQDDLFRARMVEQVSHIEHYRMQVQHREGRRLSSEEAAREWIEKFAADFPDAGQDDQ